MINITVTTLSRIGSKNMADYSPSPYSPESRSPSPGDSAVQGEVTPIPGSCLQESGRPGWALLGLLLAVAAAVVIMALGISAG